MREWFVPTSYQRDLRKKLQRLEQGDMSVQEYYAELQKGMICCGVKEETEDKIVRFYGGLRREIQDIVDYKEFSTVNRLFQLAMLAEKELQGRQTTNRSSSTFTPRTSTGQARTAPSSSFRRSTPPPSTPPRPAASAPSPHVSDSSKMKPPTPAKSSSSVASTGRTSTEIRCHRCQGMGHVQRECPSKRAYVATEDGGYISASDIEEDVNNIEEANEDDGDTLSSEVTAAYRSIIVQHVLSAQMEQAEKQQRHNLFQIFFVINNRRARVIIESGSCNNLVSTDLVKKLGLTTRSHTRPYHIQWLNDFGKAKVTKTVRVHFFIGSYADFADCDVVPMQASSLLLGCP